MWIVVGIVIGIALLLGFFRLLGWWGDRTYKPTAVEIRSILEASLDGRLSIVTFDQFSCVPIAYDPRLDRIRERFNAIVEDPAHEAGEITWANATPLTEAGKAQMRALIEELDAIAT